MIWPWWCPLLLTLLTCAWTVYSEELDPIVWTSSNPIFRRGMRFIAQVRIEDTIDIVCPQTPNTSTPKPDDYHIYLVDREDYVKCDSRSGQRLLTCDEPHLETKFTFLFAQLSPIPNDFVFEPCRDYHLISTNNVTGDIDNRVGGVCKTNNMKLIIRVSCSVPTYTVATPEKTTPLPTTRKTIQKTETIKTTKLSYAHKTPSSMNSASSIDRNSMLLIRTVLLAQMLWLIL
ncbi:ephrin-B1-like [Ptychodera flava]|uniref:ephrin-B1-like n=1 Tax=Ptychodera flava TaxID=63121 RepID=UPI00396A9CF9